MELPIQVVIVFFIAIVVGGAILAFSRTTLDKAQTDLNDRFRDDPANKDIVLQVTNASATTFTSLAQECVERNIGETFERKTCFAVFSPSFSSDWRSIHGARTARNFTINITAPASVTAVRVIFDPKGTVEISQ